MTTPVSFPSTYSFVSLGKETIQGTAVAPTDTLMLNSPAQTKDNLEKLEDVGLRQSLSEVYGAVEGAISSEVQLDGDVRVDTIGYLLYNILGDLTTTGVATPYSHAFSLLNTMGAQPPSYTVTDFSGITASVGARDYPGFMCSELTFDIDPGKLFTFSAKGMAYDSAPSGAEPSPAVSTLEPLAGWRAALGIGGPASGGTLINSVTSMQVTITRALKVYNVLGQQRPYKIQTDKCGFNGKFTMIAASEQALLDYLTNAHPQLQILVDISADQKLQLDMQRVFYSATQLNRGEEAAIYDVEWKAEGNTTNVGASGGFSPGKVTLTNSVATY